MKLKIAAVQTSSQIGRREENVRKALGLTREAIEKGAKIICLPELFNTGYFCHTTHADVKYYDLAEPLDGYTITTFRQVAEECAVCLVVPFVEYERPGVLYNSACIIDAGGEILGCYRKVHVPWSHTGWEKFYFRRGYDIPVFDTAYGRIGIMICYDRDFPELARTMGLKGAEMILVPNGAGVGLMETWKSLMQTRAYENQLYILGACLAGGTDEEHHEFMGTSLLVDPFGKMVSCLGREEGLLVEEIDTAQIAASRKSRFLYRDRRPDMYSEIVRLK